jgi:hypothetical protein
MKVPSVDKVRKLPLASMHRISIGCCDIVGFAGYFLIIVFFFRGAPRRMKTRPAAAY